MTDILGHIDLLDLFLAMLVAGAIYMLVDGLARLGAVKGENGRKMIHILIGVFAASMPLFLTRTEIFVFHGLFFVGIVFLSLLSDFMRIHRIAQNFRLGRLLADLFERYEDVKRWTIGQFLYPLSLMLVVLFFDDLTIYSFAVLHLALADGFAAVIGKPFGRIKYQVPGGTKSLLGSLTFFLISATLVGVYVFGHTAVGAIAPLVIFAFALIITVSEGALAGGFDNLSVPIITAMLLSTMG